MLRKGFVSPRIRLCYSRVLDGPYDFGKKEASILPRILHSPLFWGDPRAPSTALVALAYLLELGCRHWAQCIEVQRTSDIMCSIGPNGPQ